MNKSLHIAHWLLVAVVIVSLLAAAQAGWSIMQTNKINTFIADPTESEQVPKHLKAQFALAYSEAEKGQLIGALERLTTVLATDDSELEAAAYFNRGNIHLRDAQALAASDTGRIALVSLAKQDYRTALLINSSLWDARYNLELALLMVPEEPAENKVYTRRKGAESVVVKAVGFRVDLP
ncbi:MAG: MxaK protein [Gammaproteobacteria bacterium]|nr:MAG: MxaK protein [Gammaproteobacteria bacterium]RKZ95299.1 MAG: MxaK protein [Gammaproteobacteria bacterium]RKZ98758.1 MAG: MxaK protein [Gammaproteobacteria bacterium]